MKILLLGATGLIGGHCLEFLLAQPEVTGIIAPVRRTLTPRHAKVEHPLVDFDHLDQHPEIFAADAILCCLGTTIKQAGSRENFRKVDYQYCLEAAKQGRAYHVRSFLLISAIGASAASPFFYSRVKGELERDLRSLNFDNLSIYHPSMLLGDRDEFRLGESIIARITPLLDLAMRGSLKPYHSIEAQTVARAMCNEALMLHQQPQSSPQVRVHDYENILELAQSR